MDAAALEVLLEEARQAGISLRVPRRVDLTADQAEIVSRNVVVSDLVRQRVESLLLAWPEVTSIVGTLVGLGTGGEARFEIRGLATHLLYRTAKVGAKTAAEEFVSHVDSRTGSGLEILAISGLEVPQDIPLTDSISLVPFSAVPSSPPKESLDGLAMQSLVNRWLGGSHRLPAEVLSYTPPAALVRRITRSMTVRTELEKKPAPHPLEPDLDLALESLSLLGVCACGALSRWIHFDDSVPEWRYIGISWTNEEWESRWPTKFYFGPVSHDIDWCRRYLALPKPLLTELRIPLQRLNSCRRRRFLADRAIDLGIVMESLFLDEKPPDSSIGQALRLRAAWFMGSTLEERREISAFIGAAYSCRSSAAHDGELEGTRSVAGHGKVPVDSVLATVEGILVQALRKIIARRSRPNWNDLVLGGVPPE